MLLDRYSFDALPLRHAEGRSFTPGQVYPVNFPPVKRPLPVTCLLVKAHTKLPILHIRISQRLTLKSIESTDQVDRTSLKSSQSTFNTYEVNEIGSVITYSVTTAVGASKMF